MKLANPLLHHELVFSSEREREREKERKKEYSLMTVTGSNQILRQCLHLHCPRRNSLVGEITVPGT